MDWVGLFAVGSSCLSRCKPLKFFFDFHFCFVIYKFGSQAESGFSVTKSLLALHLGLLSYNDFRIFLLPFRLLVQIPLLSRLSLLPLRSLSLSPSISPFSLPPLLSSSLFLPVFFPLSLSLPPPSPRPISLSPLAVS